MMLESPVDDFKPIDNEFDFAGDQPLPVWDLDFVLLLNEYFMSFFWPFEGVEERKLGLSHD